MVYERGIFGYVVIMMFLALDLYDTKPLDLVSCLWWLFFGLCLGKGLFFLYEYKWVWGVCCCYSGGYEPCFDIIHAGKG